jgi:hypothetical protein
MLAVIKYIYLLPTYLHFIQDVEDRCLLLTSSWVLLIYHFRNIGWRESIIWTKIHAYLQYVQNKAVTENMTRGDDVAQRPGPTEPKWGWQAPPPWLTAQVLVPFQTPLCQHVKEGQCMGHPMPKVGEPRKLGHPATLAGRSAWQVPPPSPTFGQSTDLTLL